MKVNAPVSTMRNIGPISAQWLNNVGILTTADLAHLGSVIAFRIVKESGYPASLNMLYALGAAPRDIDWRPALRDIDWRPALRDIDWRELDVDEKERLRRESGV